MPDHGMHTAIGSENLEVTMRRHPTGPTTLMWKIGELAQGLAALALGALGLATGDFALNWQPVPEWVPGRTALAYLTAGLFAALGAGLLMSRNKFRFAAALAAAFLLWALLLHGPAVVAAPQNVLAWLGFTERLAVAVGALALAAAHTSHRGFLRWGTSVARVAFGACLPIFGWSHFAYIEFTAGMVPSWLPASLFWAYLTGAAHIAAGISMLTSVLARLGSFLFALMVSSFVLLLHVPAVMGHPGDRREWTMLAIATSIAAAAWCVAASLAASRPGRDRARPAQ